METQKMPQKGPGEQAHLGKSVIIKGEVSGSEDLYLDGQIEGAIDLKGNQLTLGPNGRVKADISARSAVIHGKLEGNINATDRVDLKQSAIVTGDIVTQRISIDDGAFFKGGVDISRSSGQVQGKTESKPALGQGAAATGNTAQAPQAPVVEPRK